ISGNGAQAIRAANIELNNRAGRVTRDASCIERARVIGHGGMRPGSAICRPPDLTTGDALRVMGEDRHRDWLARLRNDGPMLELAEGRAYVSLVARVARAGRAVADGSGQSGRAGSPIEIKPGVEQVVSRQPFRAEGDLILAAIGDAEPRFEC